MKREFHVRFCERPTGKFLWPTRLYHHRPSENTEYLLSLLSSPFDENIIAAIELYLQTMKSSKLYTILVEQINQLLLNSNITISEWKDPQTIVEDEYRLFSKTEKTFSHVQSHYRKLTESNDSALSSKISLLFSELEKLNELFMLYSDGINLIEEWVVKQGYLVIAKLQETLMAEFGCNDLTKKNLINKAQKNTIIREFLLSLEEYNNNIRNLFEKFKNNKARFCELGNLHNIMTY